MANVIREDVISVEFDFDNSVFSDMLKQIDEFKQGLNSGFDTSGIDDIKKSTEPVKEAIKDLDNGIKNAKKEFSAGIDTSGIDDVKKSTEQAKESVKKFAGIARDIERFDERMAALKNNFNALKINAAAAVINFENLAHQNLSNLISGIKTVGSALKNAFVHPLSTIKNGLSVVGNVFSYSMSTIKNGLSSVKNEIAETVSNIKKLVQTKMSNLTSNIKEIYSTLSRGQTGAKGFVTALKSIGKVGLEKTISGAKAVGSTLRSAFESIKNSIKNISFEKVKSGLLSIKNVTFDKIKSGLSTVKSGVSAVISGIKKFDSAAKNTASKIKSAFTSVGSKIKSVANSITGASDTITSKLFNIKSLVAGVATGALVQNSVGIVVDRQNITSQFEVLLGSAEKAQERVSELTDFAGMTPFTRDEIFAASKQLQVFTGNALSTGDSLRVIGDVAAGTGQPFEDVALWVGRLYDSMKSGRPVGEMTSRLQEMGAISGEDRAKIEKLAKSGENIKDIWGDVEKIFSRYDGTMEKLSNNLGNMLTSLKSFATNSIFLPLGEGIASGLQPAIQKFRDFRKANKADVDAMGEVIHNFAENICVPLFNKIEQGAEFVIKAVGSLKNGMSGLNNLKGTSPLLDKLIDVFNFVFAHKEAFIDAFKKIAAAMGGIVAAGKFTKIISSLNFMLNPLTLVTVAFGVLFTALKTDSENGGTALTDLKNIAAAVFDAIKGAVSAFSEIISSKKDVFADVINTIVDLLPPLAEAFGELLTAGLELAEAALPVLLDVFRELFDAVKPLLKQLPDFIKFIADIIKACAKADVIEILVKGFLAYKAAVFAANAVTKIHSALLVVLRAKTLIATAAQKLLNLAMNANPILLVVSAIGLLIGALVTYSALTKDSSDETEALNQHIKEITSNAGGMRSAFDNAKVTLPDLDRHITSSGNIMGDIDTQIAEKEQAITEVLQEAIKEQKGVRDEDIKNIKQYLQDIQDLENEKLSVYADRQIDQINALNSKVQFGYADKQEMANILASGTETYNQSVEAINSVFKERETTLNQCYSAEKTLIENNEKLTGMAKSEALKQANARYQNDLYKLNEENQAKLDEAKLSVSTLYDTVVSKSSEALNKTGFDFGQLKTLTETAKTDLAEYERYQEGVLGATEEDLNNALYNMYTSNEVLKSYLGGMNEETVLAANDFLTTLNEARNSGADISDEMKLLAETILVPFGNLPPELQEEGKQILAGLIQGLQDENGNAIDTTDMSCQEIINAAKEALGIHSPSRIFNEIGVFIGEGLEQGIKTSMEKISGSMPAYIGSIIDSAKDFNLDSVGQSTETMSISVNSSFEKMEVSAANKLDDMKRTTVSIITGITSIVIVDLRNMSAQSVAIINGMSVGVTSAITQMKSNIDAVDLYSSGTNIMNGLINGMESRRGELVNTAQSIARTVKNTMDHSLDIHSPSKELYKTGVYTGQGQIEGMKSTLPEVRRTANEMGKSSIPGDGRYAPTGDHVTYSRRTSSESHTYAPVFNLTISGSVDDRATARKVKKWVAEEVRETFESYERKNS